MIAVFLIGMVYISYSNDTDYNNLMNGEKIDLYLSQSDLENAGYKKGDSPTFNFQIISDTGYVYVFGEREKIPYKIYEGKNFVEFENDYQCWQIKFSESGYLKYVTQHIFPNRELGINEVRLTYTY
jgi:hypothetical protein